MKRDGGRLSFSPTDLARFQENPTITWMDRLSLERPASITADPASPELEILASKGQEHEQRFLDSLRAAGRDVCVVSRADAFAETLDALRSGREVIYQAALAHGDFAGFADFLVRVDRASRLGDYSYEPWDTKLAREGKPHFLVQLCCYAEGLEVAQGVRPEHLVVVLGNGEQRRFRTDDFFFYYGHLKEDFLAQQRDFDPMDRPEPGRSGTNGCWESECAQWLEREDHLLRVADIRQDQIKKLRVAGIRTMRDLAENTAVSVRKMAPRTLGKLRQQARLQIHSSGVDRPLYEVVAPDPEDPRRGLALLPPASPLDVVFDIEGFPLAEVSL